MDAPDPLLPDNNLLPTLLWLGVLLITVVASVVHAVRRKRAAWVVGMVLLPPVGIVGYWFVELLRPSGWIKESRATE